ncbi:L-aspartate oxidase [Bergeyella zoohelcum]|uniref:L-aspartate oxidase n=1 Tax=Bergeyella zoohelcum TaxID=1015 RepID=A0A7Z8YLW5_9FLAO|nr:L-aspartate oxidase [Bergeyella zoohelcum]VDH02784.1 fumarate reductase flavoprotein subunit [Bergeyella zoohelcum]
MKTHFLIIGSGIAGLSLAIQLSEKFSDKKITIVTKSKKNESNTRYAQGGIAVVQHIEDSFEKHIQDTLIAGDGLCDEAVVRMVVEKGPQRLQELILWGAQFDKNGKELDLGMEGGHSENRVVHAKDQTGYEIEKALIAKAQKQKNIEILEFHFATDLMIKDNQCYGAKVLNEHTQNITPYWAEHTIIATGGIGVVYGHTTNPKVATGDGIAMAHRAGATIQNMEFVQFHPTALYNKNIERTFLISEAVRGLGAFLRTQRGERFMPKYDTRADLAPRDIVSLSIYKELKKSGNPCVYMDCTHLDMTDFKKHFPMIYDKCSELRIDIAKDWIPVAPSQHYLCGGIAVDMHGRTSIQNLFACGECTQTGLHGANRLASNSLLEAVVYSHEIYRYIVEHYSDAEISHFKINDSENTVKENISAETIAGMLRQLQSTMHQKAGIVRTDEDLTIAKNKLEQLTKELSTLHDTYAPSRASLELLNMLTVGMLIIEHSLQRTENKGGFMKVN